jgi:Dyp-type peroxidase family
MGRQPAEPELAIDQIQGNVLPGFRTDAQVLLALRISQPGAARDWLSRAAKEVTTAHHVFDVDQAEAEAKMGHRPPPARGPWLNLGLSYSGLTALTATSFRFADEALRDGLAARSYLLGDPTDPRAEGHRSGWNVGRPGEEPDVLLLVAGELDNADLRRRRARDDPATAHKLEALAQAWAGQATASGLDLLWQETGMTLSRGPSTEHFGFRDGISQPGIRGLLPGSRGFVTPRVLRNRSPKDGPELAAPGMPLVWPGSFVFGYPAQNPVDARTPGPVAVGGPSWTENGSLMVFRRLRQHVDRFHGFLSRVAREHAHRKLPGATPDALGALLVGRWPSGAPVLRSPDRDLPALGSDRYANNQFDFTNKLPRPRIDDDDYEGDHFPSAAGDPLGQVCPNSAHIRKANPRTGYTEQGGLEDTLARRILRRGITYGRAVTHVDHLTRQEREGDRGLHFLCYQTSIPGQFEFLMKEWFNSPTAPRGGGLDLLVGQDSAGPRSCFLVGETGLVEVTAKERWVIPTGGGYFFVPSVAAMAALANK